MTIQQKPTLEEFLRWKEQKPYLELIHGVVRQKTMPSAPHSFIQAELAKRIGVWSDGYGGFTLTEQRCILEVDTVLPDVAWFSPQQLPALPVGSVRAAPTLAVEILSAGDRYGDIQEKVLVYLKTGVRVVWVVDPMARNVTIYRPGTAPELVAPPANFQDPVLLPGLSIPLTDLFSRLPAADASQPQVQE